MASGSPQRARGVLSAQQPLFYAALAFAGGILLGERVWHPASWWIIASLAFISSAGFFFSRGRSVALFCGLLAIGALGAMNFQLRLQPAAISLQIVTLSDGA